MVRGCPFFDFEVSRDLYRDGQRYCLHALHLLDYGQIIHYQNSRLINQTNIATSLPRPLGVISYFYLSKDDSARFSNEHFFSLAHNNGSLLTPTGSLSSKLPVMVVSVTVVTIPVASVSAVSLFSFFGFFVGAVFLLSGHFHEFRYDVLDLAFLHPILA